MKTRDVLTYSAMHEQERYDSAICCNKMSKNRPSAHSSPSKIWRIPESRGWTTSETDRMTMNLERLLRLWATDNRTEWTKRGWWEQGNSSSDSDSEHYHVKIYRKKLTIRLCVGAGVKYCDREIRNQKTESPAISSRHLVFIFNYLFYIRRRDR